MTGGSRLTPYLYVLPLAALLAFVFGYPVVRIFEFSFKMVRGVDDWEKRLSTALVKSSPTDLVKASHPPNASNAKAKT